MEFTIEGMNSVLNKIGLCVELESPADVVFDKNRGLVHNYNKKIVLRRKTAKSAQDKFKAEQYKLARQDKEQSFTRGSAVEQVQELVEAAKQKTIEDILSDSDKAAEAMRRFCDDSNMESNLKELLTNLINYPINDPELSKLSKLPVKDPDGMQAIIEVAKNQEEVYKAISKDLWRIEASARYLQRYPGKYFNAD